MSIDVKALPEDVEVTKEGDSITIMVKAQPQKNLAQCIEWIENNIDPALRRKVEVMDKAGGHGLCTLHPTLGADMVNACSLSDAGTAEVIKDFQRLQGAGVKLFLFDHFNMTYDAGWRSEEGTIYSVYHPDNCACVILDVYQELITGNIGLSLIERKD